MADRKEIYANGNDLSFITIKITDKDGNLVPDSSNLIHFNSAENGFIAWVDNGYQASHEPFKADQRKAFNGMCLAIIQSNEKSGNIIVEASSEGIEPTSILLMAS